jgi:glycosyltransferase involved in cell wall biosynthesis
MDAVLNFHVAGLHKVISKLRKAGVVTVASLHVNDLTEFDREVGHSFLALGYEHVYDFFAPCSDAMLEWCHGMGVPRDKLVLVPNAPGLNTLISDGDLRSPLQNEKTSTGPLKVLFLGRLDRQKGLDRLVETIRETRRRKIEIQWRVVGSPVVADANNAFISEISSLIEPAVYDEGQILDLYRWADVLFLPSYWEGLPLTLLEAESMGVVPMAAKVGAVSEVIADGVNGVLIEDLHQKRFSIDAADHLQELHENRELLILLSRAASEGMTRSWDIACRELILRIEEIHADRSRPPITN